MKYDLLSGKRNIRRSQGFNVTHLHFYEGPVDDPEIAEVWCYADRLSYEAGDTVELHLSTTACPARPSPLRTAPKHRRNREQIEQHNDIPVS